MSWWVGEVGQEACLLVPSEARARPSTAAPGYFSLTSLRVPGGSLRPESMSGDPETLL